MKTKNIIMVIGGARRCLLLLTVLFVGLMSVQAEDDVDYGFWVGSVKVKKSNCNNITGGNIKSGTVKYNPNTNTLTMTDVRIDGTGSGGDCIHNLDNFGLKVHLYGTNELYAKGCPSVICEKRTYFYVMSGDTYIEGYSDNNSAVYVKRKNEYVSVQCYIFTIGDATLDIIATRDYAIKGKNEEDVLCLAGKNITIQGKKGNIVNLKRAQFHNWCYSNGDSGENWQIGCDVTLVATNDSNYPSVQNVGEIVDVNYSTTDIGHPVIMQPTRAEYSSTAKSICNSSGSAVYASDIVISDQYVTIVRDGTFPDANFRNYLLNKYGLFITPSQNNDCTSMDVHGRSISSLTGIKYFTYLQTLYCNNNNITSLDVSYNTRLTGLQCDYNQLTTLYTPSSLKWLGCTHNRLSSCLQNKTYGNLKELYCSDNPSLSQLGSSMSNLSALENLECSNTKISSLQLSDCKKLKELICENNTSLSLLECNNTNLTKLSVSGCFNLKNLYCKNNNLSYLDVYGCTSLANIDCTGNALTTIYYMYSCKSLLNKLIIDNNRFSSLNMSGYSKLTQLNCNNNQLTSLDLTNCNNLYTLECSNNQLTGINNLTDCTSINDIKCGYNKFTKLTVQNYQNLTSLNCEGNKSLTELYCGSNPSLNYLYVTGCTALGVLDCADARLKSLDCSNLQLTELYVAWNSKMETLNCQNNKLTYLAFTGCSNLKELNCKGNAITRFGLLSDCISLEEMDCRNNQLTSLDLTGCNSLIQLNCVGNQLKSLIMPQSPSLNNIYCQLNQIKGARMNALVASLPNRMNSDVAGSFRVMYTGTYYTEGNECTTKNVNDAWAKNWKTYCFNGSGYYLYEGSSIPTTIQAAEADVDDDAPRYNMSGQRVGNDYKGVVIVNGKKKVVR